MDSTAKNLAIAEILGFELIRGGMFNQIIPPPEFRWMQPSMPWQHPPDFIRMIQFYKTMIDTCGATGPKDYGKWPSEPA